MDRIDGLLRWCLVCCIAATVAPPTLGGGPQQLPLEEPSLLIFDDPLEPVLYLHEYIVNGFLGSPGFGVGRSLQRFRLPGHETGDGYSLSWSDDQGHFEVPAIDLLGLVIAPKPRVYTVKEDMYRAVRTPRPLLLDKERPVQPVNAKPQKSGDLPTREPDQFEKAALALLQAGHELIYLDEASSFRALGAIRAQKSCQSCHDTAKEGDLLGAFTYFGVKTRDATEAERLERQKLREHAKADVQDATLIAKYHSRMDAPADERAVRLDNGLSRDGVVSPLMVERQRAVRASLPVKQKKGH